MSSITPSASELARQCLSKFDEALLGGVPTENQWAENRRADFNLWVDGVGAMAGRRASLDARFESRWRELTLTKNLLVKLSDYLDSCLDADDADILEEAKQNVDVAIDGLASIAVAIRQTGRKSRLLKADRNFNPAILDDLRTHLECIALIRPTLGAEIHQEHHESDPLWWQDEMNGNLTPLQRRLIEASLRRRNRFLYAQRHSKKLAYREAPAFTSQTQNVGPQPPEPEGVATPSEQIDVQFQQLGPSTPKEKPLAFAPTLSGTSASVPESKLRWKESQDVIQAPKSQITSIASATKYPMLANLRKVSSEDIHQTDFDQPKIMKCPCCCEVLPNDVVQSKNAWKKHLSADFCPYTCIAENCPMPHVLYRTRAEWEDHIKEHHPKSWKCQLCNVSQTTLFSSVDDLTQHVRHEHSDSYPEELLGTLHLWPSLTSIGLDTCPLCRSTGPRDDTVLIDHVLEHTHDFALRSLPWADLPTDRIEGSMTRGIYNLNCLLPVHPSESTGQPLPSMMHIWFEKLEMPESEQWEQSHIALAELSASRLAIDVREEVSYFTTNNYFASETEGPSLNIRKDQSLSSRSGQNSQIAKEFNKSESLPEDSVMGGTSTPPIGSPSWNGLVPALQSMVNSLPSSAAGSPTTISPRTAEFQAGFEVKGEDERFDILDRMRRADSGDAMPDGFCLPGLSSLNRYLSTYFGLFHHHLPFLHPTTFTPTEISPALLLAVLSVGALYAFEQDQAYMLHIGSKLLVNQFIQNKENFSSRKCPLWAIQSCLLNMIFASWSGDRKGIQWADSMKSLLANMVAGNRYELKLRQEAHGEAKPTLAEWVEDEGCRRTYYAVYIFFGLLTLTYNYTPAIGLDELEYLQLPSTESFWNLQDSDQSAWQKYIDKSSAVIFMEAHKNLFEGKTLQYSAFAARIMINALFLEVWYHNRSPEPLRDAETEYKLRLALETWEKSLGKCEPEAITVPLSTPSKGHPLLFNSKAIYRNARVRLELDLKAVQEAMRYHDQYEIAAAMASARDRVKRSREMIKVIEECYNYIEVAVLQGVRWVARTSPTNWSVEHPLCGMDIIVILSLWLYRLEYDEEPATQEELAMYNKVRQLFAKDLDENYMSQLSSIVARLWGSMLDEVIVWGITRLMGESFKLHSQALVGHLDDPEASTLSNGSQLT